MYILIIFLALICILILITLIIGVYNKIINPFIGVYTPISLGYLCLHICS